MFNGVIRPLQDSDIQGVEQLFDLYWSGEFRTRLSERLASQDFSWMVAEKNNEVVGVAAFRSAPDRMKQYAKTDNVVELYVIASKYKGKGIGTALRASVLEQAEIKGYTEAVFFSGETHQDSWAFHDESEFKRVGEDTAPDGEKGQIWLTSLQ